MTPFEKKLKERLDKREIQKLKRQIIKQKIYLSEQEVKWVLVLMKLIFVMIMMEDLQTFS